MADRSFGVKEINIVGSAGTPTISSPDNINLNGNRVAISTDLQVGRNASIVGVITADSFVGDGSGLTGITAGIGTQIPDNQKLNFGDSDDLQIYHNGLNNVISGVSSNGTSKVNTFVSVHDLYLNVHSGQYASARFLAGSVGVELYSGNSFSNVGYIRLAAAGVGVTVYGDLKVTAGTGGIGNAAFRNNVAIGTDSLSEATDALLVNGNVNITGVVTANSFVGDGSGLTNLPGGGGGSIAGIDTVGTSIFNKIQSTESVNVGSAGTVGVAVTYLTIDNQDISGTIHNRIRTGVGDTNAVLDIQTKEFLVTDPYAGKGALISADSSGTKLYKDNSLKLQTIGTGVTITGITYSTSFSGDGSALTNVDAATVTGASRISTQNLTVTGVSTFQDSVKIPNDVVGYFGSTNQLGLYYSSSVSQSRIDSTQPLYIRSDETRVVSGIGSTVATFTNGVSLAFDYVNKFATTAYGVDVTGTAQVDGLVNSGVSTFQDGVNVTGVVTATTFSGALNGNVTGNVTGNLTGEVNSTAFDTNSSGVIVSGIATATKVQVGVGTTGLSLEYDGTDCFIKETSGTGELIIRTNQLKVESPTFESLAIFNENSDVKLYYNNNEKIRTTNDGVVITGILTATSSINTVSDVNVGIDTSTGVILTSPNGTRYRLIVDDSGNLSTVSVP
jgi:hypothetical protein